MGHPASPVIPGFGLWGFVVSHVSKARHGAPGILVVPGFGACGFVVSHVSKERHGHPAGREGLGRQSAWRNYELVASLPLTGRGSLLVEADHGSAERFAIQLEPDVMEVWEVCALVEVFGRAFDWDGRCTAAT